MGIHRRGGRRYGYRSIRQGNRVRKIFLGDGAFSEFAERVRKLREYEEERTHRRWKSDKQRIETACREFDELDTGCELLRDATLLAAGFYRQERHAWRKRTRGLRIYRKRDAA